MNCTIIGLGLAALGVGVVSLNGAANSRPGRVFEVSQDARIEQALPQRTDIEFNGTSLVEAIESFDAMTDRSIYVHWDDLSDYGIMRDDPGMIINLTLKNVGLGRAMDLMLMDLPGGEDLAWRADEDLIELGVREMFDRRDATLISYDIGAILQTLHESYGVEFDDGKENITSLVTSMVEPNNWEDMGGAIARYNMVGGTMFIHAPQRMHERVQWLLDELSADAGVAAGDREGDAGQDEAMNAAFKPGDAVTIRVFELLQTNQWVKRNDIASHEVPIPFPNPIGDVFVVGRTPDEVEAAIVEKLADSHSDPTVKVYHTPPSRNEELAELKQRTGELDRSLRQVMAQLDSVTAANRALREELQRARENADPAESPAADAADK